MKKNIFYILFAVAFILLTDQLFGQEVKGITHTFIISNTQTDIVKSGDQTTVKSLLSGYTEVEAKKFQEDVSAFKGVKGISIEPNGTSTFSCIFSLDTSVNKKVFHNYLSQAGIEYIKVDDIHCQIQEYWRKLEQSKANHTKINPASKGSKTN